MIKKLILIKNIDSDFDVIINNCHLLKNSNKLISLKTIPNWIVVAKNLKYNNDIFIGINLSEKMDINDFCNELNELIKPEMFTIITCGLSHVVLIRDD